ncbi:MAG: hypothetical protein ABJN26_29460 [Stappiaceae bacterium]
MPLVLGSLCLLARHGKLVLIAGLVVGIVAPDLALVLKDWLPQLVALLLFVSALRIGPVEAAGTLADFGSAARTIGILQIGIPCLLALVFVSTGFSGPLATAMVLMTAASTISGSPNLTLLAGRNPAPALRLLIGGTAVLPLTALPVFWLYPPIDPSGAVAEASLNLLLIIAVATGAAFAIRHFWLRHPGDRGLQAIDGLSALAMAVVVVGLMSAVGPAIFDNPQRLVGVLAVAFGANFGLQITTFAVLKNHPNADDRVARSIVAGNRNMALFLAALPASVTDPILLFIGCYQVPMYLTPVLLAPLYRRAAHDKPV